MEKFKNGTWVQFHQMSNDTTYYGIVVDYVLFKEIGYYGVLFDYYGKPKQLKKIKRDHCVRYIESSALKECFMNIHFYMNADFLYRSYSLDDYNF
jgi:hypothetical protein